jgi:hypothetical protein
VRCWARDRLEAILGAVNVRREEITGERATLAEYDYRDETGALLMQQVRYPLKTFTVRRPDPAAPGEWLYNAQGVRRVLYRLPELAGASQVFIAEGEPDVETLRQRFGVVATCNPFGAGKWTDEYAQQLVAAGARHVYVLADNDAPGEQHAQEVVRSCLRAGLEVCRLILPDLGPKGDVTDWAAAGHTVEEFPALLEGPACVRQGREILGTGVGPHEEPRSEEGEPEGDPPYKLLKLATTLTAPAIRYRIETFLPDRMLTLLSGRDKRGKTLLAQEMVRSSLTGEPLFGRYLAAPCRVAAAFLDDPLALTLERLDILGIRHHPNLMLVSPLDFAADQLATSSRCSRPSVGGGALA